MLSDGLSLRELRYFSAISGEARNFADSAVRANWSFENYIQCAREAWLVAHEEKLRHAKWEIEEYDKQRVKEVRSDENPTSR